ncbi:MAG TPA: hypothetical protein VGL21_20880, partial [Jatrophihabitantaceae bacterium]
DDPRAVRGGEPATLAPGRAQVGNGKISEATAEAISAPPSVPALDAPTRDLPVRDVPARDLPVRDVPVQDAPRLAGPPPVENGTPHAVAPAPADAMFEGSWASATYPAGPSNGGAAPPLGDVRPPAEPATSNVDELGLPRRVRQASLAPQLRDDEPIQPAAAGGPPGDRSPEQTRSLMTAIQHGWQRGRSDADPSSAGPGMGAAPGGNPGMDDPEYGHRPYGGGEHRRP